VDFDLRHITSDDFKFLYDLLLDRDPRINISHKSMPTYEEHCKYWLSRPYVWDRLIWCGPERSGYCYVTQHSEIGIFLASNYQGKKIGPAVIRTILDKFKSFRLLANISPFNGRSRRFFESLGFKLIQMTYAVEPPSATAEERQ